MQPKPASKYHALKWLISLTENNMQTKFNVEYNEQEVQEMIIVKKAKKALELAKLAAKALQQASNELVQPIIEFFMPVFNNPFKRPINFNNINISL